MAEEHRCQTPESNRLCVNNCGFLGSSATMNLCSNCYGDLCLKQQQQSSSSSSSINKSTVDSSPLSVSPPSSSSSSPSEEIASVSSSSPQIIIIPPLLQNPSPKLDIPEKKPQQTPNRCTTCRKRVGLTGFKCRCGTTFCGAHRYPEVHGCTYDFKSAGREEIAKANPLVKAAKLQKI
ncbi:PREDICTED: zinc finger A20 and AN1 domain-containing stress-associated protein 6-like [Camelina sativa]|uniref:Zinc finger A20 and AN1 domain-containing stress-associated protein 6-like n=1 Tax=Camelina sativa TaxID=90675 RepID=A0ABM0ZHD0_CAMSA|nr:PREDICTED: zinc finger A20 and AN1 domain-containing stress-associated protein 6-like [Camelina sativa]XP_010515754.1 PREDICTED: zinc finger A20 and AN1 domain-containing stress-associated protein 6-like [Camelina sativa]